MSITLVAFLAPVVLIIAPLAVRVSIDSARSRAARASSPGANMSQADALHVMALLDQARCLGRPLAPLIRARIWALIDNPTVDTWWGPYDPELAERCDGALQAIVGPGPTGTLWSAVVEHTDYPRGARVIEGEVVPTREQVLTALRAVALIAKGPR